LIIEKLERTSEKLEEISQHLMEERREYLRLSRKMLSKHTL